jgi:hypothetical protein
LFGDALVTDLAGALDTGVLDNFFATTIGGVALAVLVPTELGVADATLVAGAVAK